ncbi:hypothetical protein G9U51_12460 [Calidifontibacter sp. DB0510]|uniref:Uncharacterized protein n=1 Tax=Metallococcus carri TaxID=1656884 RepID=A0A967B6R8_9MICO|nr:hypothetical protein [Metallococcus carri]NHN56592.1 hypothetical protein [Metallococcus carri]NOP38891.1 hypothetical protein [Calidifontibacter sp. DB2511S]
MAGKLANGGLIALVVLDIGLVGFALHQQSAAPSDAAVAGGPTGNSAPGASTGSPSSSPTASASAGMPGPARLAVSATSQTSFWRASGPSGCAQGGSVRLEHSTDAGAKWTPVTVPAASIAALSSADNRVTLAGGDASCAPKAWSVNNDGAVSAGTAPQWSVDTKDTSKVVVGQRTSAPCGAKRVTDIASDSDLTGSVLCEGGAVKRTTNGGQQWSDQGTVDGALAIASSGGAVYAAAKADCGVQVARVGQSANGCIPGTGTVNGPADVTSYGNLLVLVTADATWTARTGDLTSWHVAKG